MLGYTGKFKKEAVASVLQAVDKFPMPTAEGIGSAQREVLRMNTLRRASYIYTAIQRVEKELANASAHGVPNDEAVTTVNALEERYFRAHVQAAAQRILAANKVDGLQWKYGDVLGWYAVKDAKTSKDCLAADGKNFSAHVPPVIGWPGVVHMNCRCYPGKPHKRAEMLP